MRIDAETAAALGLFVTKIKEQYDIAEIILFGSRARGTHGPHSDADVAVILLGIPGNFVQTKFSLDDLAFEVLLDTGIRIQPLPIWEVEWQHPGEYSNPRLLENIKRDGIIITG